MAGTGATHAAPAGGGVTGTTKASASNADVVVDVSTAPLPPLVFQCRACRLAVGDSMDFDCSVRSMSCVALTGASGLTVDEHPQATVLFPKGAAAAGAAAAARDEQQGGPRGGAASSSSSSPVVAFVSLSCSGCGARLGRRFGERGLPAELARLAGLFCLDVESISSYELGKPELVASAVSSSGKQQQMEQQQREAAAAANENNAATTRATTTVSPTTAATETETDGSLALSSLAARVAELEEELVKVQNVVLGHNEALARLAQQQQQQQQRR